MNVVKEINRINEREISLGLNQSGTSWHDAYKSSAYIYVGGLDNTLTEGDILIMFSQWGEIVDIDLARDETTGQSRGFCFLAYEDQRSTVLAVDNFNGIIFSGRTIRVDHKLGYFRKEKRKEGEESGNESDAENRKPTYNPELIRALTGGLTREQEEERRKRREEKLIAKQEKKRLKEEKKMLKREQKKRKREEETSSKEVKSENDIDEARSAPPSPGRKPLTERDMYESVYRYNKQR
ncbi:RNA-binding motif protein [Acrasis kona]|uniref:RNA-binding motif protein n=1 Tax=Acrasis kona TaxID=1008807 RepID=A0AAW2ZHG2_9EUKA